MKTKALMAVAFVALAGATGYALMQTVGSADMPGMDHSAMTMANASDSTKGFETAMAGMMKGMMMTMTGKPDLDFVQGMMPHHQGAIDMAKVVLQFGKDPEIKKLAQAVVKAQEGEIDFMKDWLARADQAAFPVVPDSAKANGLAMSEMMKNMAPDYSGDADVDFVKGMIPHHQGAIDMAKVAQQYAKDPTLLQLAGDIVAAQEGEITLMKDWLKKNGQ
jgi:uncharacterized protein (DUF305 family)